MYNVIHINTVDRNIKLVNTDDNPNILGINQAVNIDDCDNNGLITELIIIVKDAQSKVEVGTKIHNQLKGEQDYIENEIILNIDENPYYITLSFYSGCKCNHTIII